MNEPFFTDDELTALRVRDPASIALRKPGPTWLLAQNRPLYLFGCGAAGRTMLGILGRDSIRGAIDNDPAKWGKNLGDLRIQSPQEAANHIPSENALILVSVLDERAALTLMEQCRGYGWEYIDYIETEDLAQEPISLGDLAENPHAAECLAVWADDESRLVFRSIVRYRTTLDRADAPEYSTPPYFVDLVPRALYRDFVDVGAFTGDTMREFRTRFGDDFDSYFAMEPNGENWSTLDTATQGDPRFVVCMAAAFDRAGTMAMSMNGPNLIIDSAGKTAFRVERLDDVLTGRRVGLIKMDIEGAEPSALQGAEKTIRRERPALAICVYHAADHLWSIPFWIHGLGLGYQLYLRHHTRGIWDTVCYAVPG